MEIERLRDMHYLLDFDVTKRARQCTYELIVQREREREKSGGESQRSLRCYCRSCFIALSPICLRVKHEINNIMIF